MPHPFAISVTIRAVDEVTKTLNRITGNISKQKSALSDFNLKMDALSQARGIGSALKGLSGEVGGLFHSLETKRFFAGIEDGIVKASKLFDSLGGSIKKALGGMTASTLMIGGLGFSTSRVFSGVSDSQTRLKQEAHEVQMSPSELKAYQLLGQSVGLEDSQITQALIHLAKLGTELRKNNVAPLAPFAALPGGVRFLDDKNRERPVTKILEEISDKLNTPGISEPTRIYLAKEGFLSSDILALTSLGSRGIEQRVKRYQKVTDSERAQSHLSNATYLDALSQFKGSLEHIGVIASMTFLPQVAKGLLEVSQWLDAHYKQIQELFKGLGEAIPKEMSVALSWVHALIQALIFLSRNFGLTNLAVGLLAGSLFLSLGKAVMGLLPLLTQLQSVWAGVSSLFIGAGALLSQPVTWLIASITILIGSIAYLGVILYKNWDKIRDSFFDLKEKLKSSFAELISNFVSLLKKGKDALFEFTSKALNLKLPQFTFDLKSKPKQEGKSAELSSIRQNNEPLRQIVELTRVKPYTQSSKEEKEAKVTIRFENMPQGARVEQTQGNARVNLFAGYQLAGEACFP